MTFFVFALPLSPSSLRRLISRTTKKAASLRLLVSNLTFQASTITRLALRLVSYGAAVGDRGRMVRGEVYCAMG